MFKDGALQGMEIWELLAPSGQEAFNECRWSWGISDPPEVPANECTSLAFNRDCSIIGGVVQIRFAMTASYNIDTAQSRMEEYLQRLGLGNATEMVGLFIYNIGVTVNTGFHINTFKKLQRVQILSLSSQSSKGPSGQVSTYNVFTGVQGLKNLEQVGYMQMQGTSLHDLEDFSGLRCVGVLEMGDNPLLTSLQGLENVQYPTRGLTLGGQPLLVGPESIIPLQRMVGCNVGPPANNFVQIYGVCPNDIDSWEALCGILEKLNCSAPPFPRGPTPPSP